MITFQKFDAYEDR